MATELRSPAKDYYRVLQLDPSADAELVDRAYWRLAYLYNAALRSDPSAKAKLDELNEAYAVLGSPALRRDYDRAHGIVRRDSEWVRETLRGERRPGLFRRARRPKEPPRREYGRPEPVRQEEQGEPGLPRREPPPQAPALPKRPPPRPARKVPKLKGLGLPWPVFASTVSVLALASAALLTGAHPALVLALVVVAVTFTATSILPALRLRAQIGPLGLRRPPRPANLGDVAVPGGSSQGVRKLVYQIYAQCPHLGPGDVQAVARYALLTQRFVRVERSLGKAYTGSDGDWWHLAAEQRTLAAELRRHENALGLTRGASTPASGHASARPGQQPEAPGAGRSPFE